MALTQNQLAFALQVSDLVAAARGVPDGLPVGPDARVAGRQRTW